jgi:hypothetical protein
MMISRGVPMEESQLDFMARGEAVTKRPSASRFAPNLICFAFVRKQFPFQNRLVFEIQHKLALMRGVKELVEHHGCDVPTDGFEKCTRNGFMDAELVDSLRNPVTLEATGSDRVKIQKVVQACLYRSSDSADSSGRVLVSAINEIVECPRRLILEAPDVSSSPRAQGNIKRIERAVWALMMTIILLGEVFKGVTLGFSCFET